MSTGAYMDKYLANTRAGRKRRYAGQQAAARYRGYQLARAGYTPMEVAALPPSMPGPRMIPQIPAGYPSGAIAQEFKSIDTATNGVADATGFVQLLNGCAQGSDIGDRVGRQIMMKSIQAKLYSYVTPATGVDQVHRLMIVYDRQVNGSLPSIATILNTVTPYSMKNLNYRKRFKILMDKTFVLSASGEDSSQMYTEFYRKLRHPVEFNAGNAGTVADIITGSLYLVSVGNIGAGAPAGVVTGNLRVRYTDN